MKEYQSRFKSENIERIVNRQTHLLRPELVEFVSRTSNGKAIDYTHTIDINFEERKHDIQKRLSKSRKAPVFNILEYERLIGTLTRMSSTRVIELDLIAFLMRIRKRLDFDAYYIIPNENHVHILLVLYDGDIKRFIRQAKGRPYCWNVKWDKFDTTMDEYLENKVGYLMKNKNMNMKNYEEIIYDFYPDKNRINSFFDKFRNMYEYRLHEMSKKMRKVLSST
jgi:hypothetical protein